MTWQLSPARDAFPAFAPEWDRLNRELYQSHPLFDSRFVGPLLEYFADGSERLCTHRTGDTIDGALILRPLGLGRWALFLPSQAQVAAVLLRDARLLETLFPALPGQAWTLDLLAQDPNYCPDWRQLPLPRRQLHHSLTMAVAVKGRFEDYWGSRSKQLRKNLRRYQHRSTDCSGTPRFVIIDKPERIQDAVARYGVLESSGWKGREGTAVAPKNEQGLFYVKLMQGYAQTGQARVVELWLDEQLAASRLIITHGQMWSILKTTYDESLAALAPGRQLLHETLHQAFSTLEAGSVEFYTNTTQDQAEWATDLRFILHHQIYRNRATANLHTLVHALSPQKCAGKQSIIYDPVQVSAYPSIDSLTEEAVSLFNDAAQDNIESASGWFANLQRTVFTDDPGVRYYVKTFDGEATAALPLCLTRHGPVRQIEALGNYYTSLYQPAMHASADLTPLLQAAIRDHNTAHVMRFAPMDPDSPAYAALLTALRSIGWEPFHFYCFGNWYLEVTGKFNDYMKSRSGSLRNTIKRMNKKFTADGGELEIIITPDKVAEGIEAFNHVYLCSWKKPEPYPKFIPGLIRWLASDGLLRLGIARLKGQPIAAQLWITNHGKASIYKVAYDENYASYSPGTLVTSYLLEYVIDHDKVKEVDFLIGDDKYKQIWMNHRRERRGIIAYNPATIIGLILLTTEMTGRFIRRIIQMTR